MDRAEVCPDSVQSEDALAAEWTPADRVKDMAEYQSYRATVQLPVSCFPSRISQHGLSAFIADPRYQQVTDTGQAHVTFISIHSCGLTREGVETNLAHAYITTGRGGQVNQASWWLFGVCCVKKEIHETHRKKTRQRAGSAPSLPGTKCAKLRCHTSKVKISFNPNVVAKSGTLGNTHKSGNSIVTCTKL